MFNCFMYVNPKSQYLKYVTCKELNWIFRIPIKYKVVFTYSLYENRVMKGLFVSCIFIFEHPVFGCRQSKGRDKAHAPRDIGERFEVIF